MAPMAACTRPVQRLCLIEVDSLSSFRCLLVLEMTSTPSSAFRLVIVGTGLDVEVLVKLWVFSKRGYPTGGLNTNVTWP